MWSCTDGDVELDMDDIDAYLDISDEDHAYDDKA